MISDIIIDVFSSIMLFRVYLAQLDQFETFSRDLHAKVEGLQTTIGTNERAER
jgi:hypothetical protein